METDEVAKLQEEIRSLKKKVERLEASRATFELMVDRNDKLLSSQLEQTNAARRRIVEITDNVPCVVFEFEKTRDGAARAPFVSGGMEALIGVSAAEVMKDVRRYFATVLPEDVEGYVADIDRSATTGSDHRFTVRIRTRQAGRFAGCMSMPQRQMSMPRALRAGAGTSRTSPNRRGWKRSAGEPRRSCSVRPTSSTASIFSPIAPWNSPRPDTGTCQSTAPAGIIPPSAKPHLRRPAKPRASLPPGLLGRECPRRRRSGRQGRGGELCRRPRRHDPGV